MDKPLPLSISLITLNEEANLPRCLESVGRLAAEIVVVDSGSSDHTETIARGAGAVFLSHRWQGFTEQKNLSLQRCTQPWVLCLDADEALSPELQVSLRRTLSGTPGAQAFSLNRRTFYLGDWIWHSWYPEWRVRLIRREGARWAGADPHPSLETPSPAERLTGDLLHYPYKDLSDHLQRTLRYARTSAPELQSRGKVPRWYHLAFSPWAAFWKKLLLKQGWRDGWRGWVIAYATAFGVFAKYAFALQAHRGSSEHGPGRPSSVQGPRLNSSGKINVPPQSDFSSSG